LAIITVSAGVLGLMGYFFLYRGFQRGSVSVVAPITASWSVITALLSFPRTTHANTNYWYYNSLRRGLFHINKFCRVQEKHKTRKEGGDLGRYYSYDCLGNHLCAN
jgi:hypothetical protein